MNVDGADPGDFRARPSTGRLTLATGRWVVLRGKLTRLVAHSCMARLLVLAAEDAHQPIVMDIDSPGGSAAAAISIISTMQGIRSPVLTFCRRHAIGPAALIAACGLRGHRAAVENARFSLDAASFSEQRPGGFEASLPYLTDLLTESTRRSETEVLRWFEPGIEFGASEAIKLSIIDVLASEPKYPNDVVG